MFWAVCKISVQSPWGQRVRVSGPKPLRLAPYWYHTISITQDIHCARNVSSHSDCILPTLTAFPASTLRMALAKESGGKEFKRFLTLKLARAALLWRDVTDNSPTCFYPFRSFRPSSLACVPCLIYLNCPSSLITDINECHATTPRSILNQDIAVSLKDGLPEFGNIGLSPNQVK